MEKENGLPEVSQSVRKKMPFMLVAVGMIGVLLAGVLFHSKPVEKAEKPIEETYVPKNQEAEVSKSVGSSDNTAKEITPEMAQAQATFFRGKEKRT